MESKEEAEWTKNYEDFTQEEFRQHILATQESTPIPTLLNAQFFSKFPTLIVHERREKVYTAAELEDPSHFNRPEDIHLADKEGNLQEGCTSIDVGSLVRCAVKKSKREDE